MATNGRTGDVQLGPSEADAPSCGDAITQFMIEYKPYLGSNFSIKDLSDALSIPSYRISKAINQEMGRNFFQMVNHHRVKAPKDAVKGLAPFIQAVYL